MDEEDDTEIVHLVISKSDVDGRPTVKALGYPAAVDAIRKVIKERSMAIKILQGIVQTVEFEQSLDEMNSFVRVGGFSFGVGSFVLVGSFSSRYQVGKEEAVFVMREVLGWTVTEHDDGFKIERGK